MLSINVRTERLEVLVHFDTRSNSTTYGEVGIISMGVPDVAKDCGKTVAREKAADSANVLLHEACIQRLSVVYKLWSELVPLQVQRRVSLFSGME